MTSEFTVQLEMDFGSGGRTRKNMTANERDAELPRRIPRVAKLMALAIRFDQLLRDVNAGVKVQRASGPNRRRESAALMTLAR